MIRSRLVRAWCTLAVGALALPATMAFADDQPPSFFDPLITTSPGISREVDGSSSEIDALLTGQAMVGFTRG
jgi:hypothetical protein